MSERTSIEWCDATFNPWWGCVKVSPACDHCYAERDAQRFAPGRVLWGAHSERRTFGDAHWNAPRRWAKTMPAKLGRRPRVFCSSMADVFDSKAPAGERGRLFELIRQTPELDWLLLTKRPQNIVRMVRAEGAIAGNGTRYLPDNAWLGTTAEDQVRADTNVPALLRTRTELGARVLFLSIEPMLGPVDLRWIDDGSAHRDVPRECWGSADDDDSPPGLWWDVLTGERSIMHGGSDVEWSRRDAHVDWVICGGESGPKARPMHPDWARSLRDQCEAAGVPFLFKQWGEWLPRDLMGADEKARTAEHPWLGMHNTLTGTVRVGKKAAGRLLDGALHDGFPDLPRGAAR